MKSVEFLKNAILLKRRWNKWHGRKQRMTFRNSVKLQEPEAKKFKFAIEMSDSEGWKSWIMHKRLAQLLLYADDINKIRSLCFYNFVTPSCILFLFPWICRSVGRSVRSKNITRDVKYETLASPLNNLTNRSNLSISILIFCRTLNKLHVHFTDRMVTSV
jgi:hypothetical protein